MSLRLLEKDYQLAFFNKYRNQVNLQKEVTVPTGIIDFIWQDYTSSKLIEFKHYRSIKHAIGQLISYRVYRPNVTYLEVIYFDYNPSNNIKLKAPEKGFYALTKNIPNLIFSNVLQYLTTEELLLLTHSPTQNLYTPDSVLWLDSPDIVNNTTDKTPLTHTQEWTFT